MPDNRIAAVIVNYNMPERADALARSLMNTDWPIDRFLVDNGSDLTEPAFYTTVKLDANVQTTGGWLAGLAAADKTGANYFAYLFLITSAEFLPDQPDPVRPMVEFLLAHPDAVGIHPSLTPDSTTSWAQLYNEGGNAPRRTWMIDNICSLYRADWFDSVGRFDPRFKYGWGVDLETCYLARKQGRGLWVDDRVAVKKVTDIAYTMERMHMSAYDRRLLAGNNMRAVLYEKYGSEFWHRMTGEYITDDMQ